MALVSFFISSRFVPDPFSPAGFPSFLSPFAAGRGSSFPLTVGAGGVFFSFLLFCTALPFSFFSMSYIDKSTSPSRIGFFVNPSPFLLLYGSVLPLLSSILSMASASLFSISSVSFSFTSSSSTTSTVISPFSKSTTERDL